MAAPLLEEDENLTIEEAALAASALAAFGGRGHAEALATLQPWPSGPTGQAGRACGLRRWGLTPD
jgi:hypothetical protein